MPYTLAHPAAVLSFRRVAVFSKTALVIGAMAPDFEHLLRLEPVSLYSHSIIGLFLFCWPIGLLATWLYRKIWILPLTTLLPFLEQYKEKSNFIRDSLSIVVGASTHLLWDGFTHANRFGTQLLPSLNAKIDLFSLSIPMWNILQHLSTLIGLSILLAVVISRCLKASPTWWYEYSWKIVLIALGLFGAAILSTHLFWPSVSAKKYVVLSANNFLVLLIVLLTVIGVHLRLAKQKEY